MRFLQVDPDWQDKPRRRAARNLSVFVLAMVCGAWIQHTMLNAADWRTSDHYAREILADSTNSAELRRDALYTIFRHELLNAEALKRAAEEVGYVGDHARNYLRDTKAAWR